MTSPLPWYLDLLGVGWVVAAAFAVMLPALIHGASLGPYGLLAHDGLLRQHGGGARNPFGADQVTQMIPWTTLAWHQVHHGQLPLWNPYNALGTPLAFNWQSATFSLPALLGYLMPVRLAYTTQVLATLVIGGTGCYFFARVIHLNVVACAFAGTVFELCGTFMGWLGWPVASVMSWAGWLFAAAVLVLRGGRRVRSVAFFSLVLALAVYAGQPDTLVLLGGFLAVFVAVVTLIGESSGESWRRRIRCLADLLVAIVAGLALGAPLLLPGIQLLSASSRDIGGGVFSVQQGLPLRQLLAEAVPGLGGDPIAWNRTYIGVVAVALALIGLVLYRRRPAVSAMGAVAVVAGVITFTPLASSLLNHLPGLGAVRWARSITFLEFAIAILAGVGMDVFIRLSNKKSVLRLAGAVFSLAALVVAAIWVTHPRGDRVRHQNLAWALAGACLGLILVGCLQLVRMRGLRSASSNAEPGGNGGRYHAVRLWGLGVAVLLFRLPDLLPLDRGWIAVGLQCSPIPLDGCGTSLKRAVGSSLVGLGATACERPPTLGIPANANIAYGIHANWRSTIRCCRGRTTKRGALPPMSRPDIRVHPLLPGGPFGDDGTKVRCRLRPGLPENPRAQGHGLRRENRERGPLPGPWHGGGGEALVPAPKSARCPGRRRRNSCRPGQLRPGELEG